MKINRIEARYWNTSRGEARMSKKWVTGKEPREDEFIFCDGKPIANFSYGNVTLSEAKKNAARAVEAVNAHDKMAEALRELIAVYWANKGSDAAEFIATITPKGIPDYWRKADAILKEIGG